MSNEAASARLSWEQILERLGVIEEKRQALLKEEYDRQIGFVRDVSALFNSVNGDDSPQWVKTLIAKTHAEAERSVQDVMRFHDPKRGDEPLDLREWGKHVGYEFTHAKSSSSERTEWQTIFALQWLEARWALEAVCLLGTLAEVAEFCEGFVRSLRQTRVKDGPPRFGRDPLSYHVRIFMMLYWREVENCQCLDDCCKLLLSHLPEHLRKRIGFREFVRGICRSCGKKFPRPRGGARRKKAKG